MKIIKIPTNCIIEDVKTELPFAKPLNYLKFRIMKNNRKTLPFQTKVMSLLSQMLFHNIGSVVIFDWG